MKKYILVFAFVIAVINLLPLLFVSAKTTSSASELQSAINQLQEQIKLLQSKIVELQSQIELAKVAEIKFTKTLKRGMSGNDVKELQQFLKNFDVYTGRIVGVFNARTVIAVKKLQKKVGIKANGIVDAKTKELFNKLAASEENEEDILESESLVATLPATSTALITSITSASIYATSSSAISTTTIPTLTPQSSSTISPSTTISSSSTTISPIITQAYSTPPVNITNTPVTNSTAITSPIITATTTTITTIFTSATTTTPTTDMIIISNNQVSSITANSATIIWSTNVPAYSWVNYSREGFADGFSTYSLTGIFTYATDHQIVLTNLQPSTTYKYEFFSKNANDTTGISFLYFTTIAANIPTTTLLLAPESLPAVPALLSVQQDPSGGSVFLTWRDNSNNEERFDFYWRSQGVASWVFDYSYLPNRTLVSLSLPMYPFPTAGIYEYKMLACNNAGCSADSNILSVNIKVISKPTNLSATLEPNTKNVLLQWIDNSNNETKFEIYRRPAGTGNSFQFISNIGANITSFTNSDLSPGNYEYEIRACDSSICSFFSDFATITVASAVSNSFFGLNVHTQDLMALSRTLESLKILTDKLLKLLR